MKLLFKKLEWIKDGIMKRYILLLVFIISCTQTRIKRPWLQRSIIKKTHPANKILQPTNSKKDNTEYKENMSKEATSAVTYALNGGRFGDNLSSYCRAFWISYWYNIPLLYKSFKHFDQLSLSNHGVSMNKTVASQFKRKLIIPKHNRYDIVRTSGLLYIVEWKSKVPIGWHDRDFMVLLKKCVTLSSLSSKIEVPQNHISVAVHVRTGGDYEPDRRIRSRQPKRFAPHQFYVDQIKRIRSMFEGKDLYVHIFTDDSNPDALMEKFKKSIEDEHIKYGCRQRGNNCHAHVLEDFFAMTKFDCLIRPESLYSIYAERFGNHEVVIYPVRVDFVGRKRVLTVREIAIKKRMPKGYITKKLRV